MENTADKMNFHEALTSVLEEISSRKDEKERLISQKPIKIKFTKDFKKIKSGDEQMVSELTMLTYKKLGVAKKVGR